MSDFFSKGGRKLDELAGKASERIKEIDVSELSARAKETAGQLSSELSSAQGKKKWIAIGFGLLVLVIVSMFAFSDSPESVVKSCVTALYKGDENAFKYYTQRFRENHPGGIGGLARAAASIANMKGGFDSVSTTFITKDNDRAEVMASVTFGNGQINKMIVILHKESGAWRINDIDW